MSDLFERIRCRLFGPKGLFAENAQDITALEECKQLIDQALAAKDKEFASLKDATDTLITHLTEENKAKNQRIAELLEEIRKLRKELHGD